MGSEAEEREQTRGAGGGAEESGDCENDEVYVTSYDVHGEECDERSACVSTSAQSIAGSVLEGTRHAMAHWKILAFGQCISFLVAGAAAGSATLHFECELSAPTAQTAGVYLLLAIHAMVMWLNRCGCCPNANMRSLSEERAHVPEHIRQTRERRALYKAGEDSNEDDEDNGNDFADVDGEIHHGDHELYIDPVLGEPVSSTHHHDDHDHHEEDDHEEDEVEDEIEEDHENALTKGQHTTHTLLGLPWLSLHAPWWSWLGIAFLDVEANYFTFLAMRYTTLTSVVLFGALAIPSAMLCSNLFLARRYKFLHLLGAAVCLAGVLTNVLADYEDLHNADHHDQADPSEDEYGQDQQELQPYPRRVLGDFLAISGGMLLGINDVLAEIAVKTFGGGWNEYCAMLGLFGTIISILQVLILEIDDISKFFSTDQDYHDGLQQQASSTITTLATDDFLGVADINDDAFPIESEDINQYDASKPITCHPSSGLLLLFVYVIANYMHYVGVSRFLVISEAALLNLSLLTADLWSAVFAVIAENLSIHPLFYLALILIISGVFLYETGPSPIVTGVGVDVGGHIDFVEDHSSVYSHSSRAGKESSTSTAHIHHHQIT